MEQTVYADLLFLVNFSMDFLCFYITSAILHKRLSVLRSFFASVAGGVYSVAILFAYLVPPFGLICDAVACALMCALVFFGRGKRISEILLSFAVYIGTSAALGGMMTALFNLLNTLELPFELLRVESEGIPVWLFALLATVSGAATLVGGRFFRSRQSQRCADVEIHFCGKSARLCAMCDNGNFARDPISGKSVIVGDLASLRKILPNEIVKAVRSGNASVLTELSPDIAKRLRLIPTSSVGGSSMLFALVPDKIVVFTEDGRSHESAALFAASSIGGAANGFEALLPPELLI